MKTLTVIRVWRLIPKARNRTRRYVHTLVLYTNVYVRFVHTSFPYQQTTVPSSSKTQERTEDDSATEEDEDDEATSDSEDVCIDSFCPFCLSGAYT